MAALVLLSLSVVAFIMCESEEVADPVGRRGLRAEVEDNNDLDLHTSIPETDEGDKNLPPSSSAAKVKVALLTSLWAKKTDEIIHPHRREIKAALMANILNPYFDQIVVVLDGTTTDSNCFHFGREMKAFAGKLDLQDDPFSKLTCIAVTTGQPTYYEMFQNAFHEKVKGDIVVLSNADQAFDHTISQAQDLNPEVLIVLGTHGFSNKMPPTTKSIYDTLVNTDYVTDREQRNGEWDNDKCRETLFSWDTFIFHKSKLMGRLREEDFQRSNTSNEMKYFYMNEMGAESAALWAVQQSYPFTSIYNACDRIQSWSFHLTPKTHHDQKTAWLQVTKDRRSPMFTPRGSVPKPWGGVQMGRHPAPQKNPDCVLEKRCFLRQT